MNKPRFFKYGSILLSGIIICFGYATREILKDFISWNDRLLVWDDFREVSRLKDDFDASVNSGIYIPDEFNQSNFKVYAYMNPNLSKRLKDSTLTDQLLIHEQYHFNITEYCVRLLRKEILESESINVTPAHLRSLHFKYDSKIDSLQVLYDNESNHNADYERQNFWEAKIDDLLRRTVYYDDPDLLSYFKVTNDSAKFFREIYVALDHSILKSYPINALEAKFGEVYQIKSKGSVLTIKFFKNGLLLNGGYFDTAITNVINRANTIEFHHRNVDSTYNSNISYEILKSEIQSNGDIITKFFNEQGERVKNGNIYKRLRVKHEDNSFISNYYDDRNELIKNKSKVYHEKRSLDSQNRTIKTESFDKQNNRMLNSDFISIYEMKYDKNNNLIRYSLYDQTGGFAKHLNSFNREYKYDERGKIKESINLDVNGKKSNDKKAVCTYKYTYDKFDNLTSERKYNHLSLPVLGYDDYFQEVSDYDSQNRLKFQANYYPNHVLYFDDYKWGASRYEYPNDSTVIEYNYDAFKNPFNSDTGVGVIKSILNDEGLENSIIYLDFKGGYAKTKDEIVEFNYKYDENNNKIEEITKDSLGCIKPFELDVAKVRWIYDDRNNKIRTSYFNSENELAKASQNITFNFYDYNEQNLLAERRNYD
ncbi:MAG: hypothetical protein JKY22_09125, partial [Flavobacteriaceae bacterium]|nr:hypothetical protein [Flavobacteriaceae bacterium]